MRTGISYILAAMAVFIAGCGDGGMSFLGDTRNEYVKPSVAVMNFQNRASPATGWNLGDGMADVLVDRLVATKRYHVIERPELDAVLQEQRLQASGQTRSQNKAATGRIKNVQYLIKGTVTDFGHVANTGGFLGLGKSDIFGNTNKAVMGMTLYVVDVESGEIICSESIQESVSAKELNVRAAYKDVAFGGTVFYQTPLGQATARVMDRAIRRITAVIASRPWEPKIAAVEGGQIIVAGGADHAVQVGAQYDVVDAGSAIFDPDNGDILGRRPGKTLGTIIIREVHDRFSVAQATTGREDDVHFQTGLKLKKRQ